MAPRHLRTACILLLTALANFKALPWHGGALSVTASSSTLTGATTSSTTIALAVAALETVGATPTTTTMIVGDTTVAVQLDDGSEEATNAETTGALSQFLTIYLPEPTGLPGGEQDITLSAVFADETVVIAQTGSETSVLGTYTVEATSVTTSGTVTTIEATLASSLSSTSSTSTTVGTFEVASSNGSLTITAVSTGVTSPTETGGIPIVYPSGSATITIAAAAMQTVSGAQVPVSTVNESQGPPTHSFWGGGGGGGHN